MLQRPSVTIATYQTQSNGHRFIYGVSIAIIEYLHTNISNNFLVQYLRSEAITQEDGYLHFFNESVNARRSQLRFYLHQKYSTLILKIFHLFLQPMLLRFVSLFAPHLRQLWRNVLLARLSRTPIISYNILHLRNNHYSVTRLVGKDSIRQALHCASGAATATLFLTHLLLVSSSCVN